MNEFPTGARRRWLSSQLGQIQYKSYTVDEFLEEKRDKSIVQSIGGMSATEKLHRKMEARYPSWTQDRTVFEKLGLSPK